MSAQPLVEYLEQLQAKGLTHVAIDEKARLIMREFYVRALGSKSSSTHTPVKENASKQNENKPIATPLKTKVEGSNIEEKLSSLKQMTEASPVFRALGSLRETLVFSSSTEPADMMFIGDAPSYHDERSVTPFGGPAGAKLNDILKAMGLTRESVHLSTILKYRPSIPNQTTNNRSANTEELLAAKSFIDQEIAVINPKVIISLGETAARFLSGEDEMLDEIRTGSHTYNSIPLITAYHPSFLMHQAETVDKRSFWEDMLRAMEITGLPISEKQRSYFLPKTK